MDKFSLMMGSVPKLMMPWKVDGLKTASAAEERSWRAWQFYTLLGVMVSHWTSDWSETRHCYGFENGLGKKNTFNPFSWKSISQTPWCSHQSIWLYISWPQVQIPAWQRLSMKYFLWPFFPFCWSKKTWFQLFTITEQSPVYSLIENMVDR